MAYDEELANRIRAVMAQEDVAVTEKKMFGGLAFLVGGHMTVSASRDGGLLARFHPDETDAIRAEPHTDSFVMRGREMDGWIRVDPEGLRTTAQLAKWVRRGVGYARTLAPK